MRRTTPLLLVLVLALLAAACTAEDPASRIAAGGPPADRDTPGGTDDQPRVMLRPFDSCEDLLGYFTDHAVDLVGPYGLGGGGGVVAVTEEEVAAEAGDADTAAPVPAAAPEADGVSGTNTQEVGVDEPDIVKTDGTVIVTAVDGQVRVVDVAAERVVATVRLPVDAGGHELLLDGDALLVLSSEHVAHGPVAGDLVPAFFPARTVVTRVDLTDPADPQVQGALRMEGTYRSARMVDGTVRLVMVSDPTGLAFTHPADAGLSAEAEAEERNREIITDSEIDDWIPHVQRLDADGQPTGPVERLADCTTINQPAQFAGLSTLSVVTFDLRGGQLDPTSSAGLVAAGDTVYASTDRLVVATSPWGGWVVPFLERLGTPDAEELTTDLHSFDITDPDATRYVASGSVPGTLLNQFALSETDGVIRVATTTGPQWFGDAGQESQSSLIILTEQDDRLVQTGRLDGLGVTERIYAVRYLGPDVAAVVTFRQVDPLYLIDTSDPADPRLLGELKIPGFSSYLHPVADGWLLGVGQDADEETGRTLGVQASLFDIRDLSNPQRVAQVTFGEGHSPVEHDHRAFLHWPPTGQVVIPVELYGPVPEPDPQGDAIAPAETFFGGAVVLDVADLDAGGSLTETARISGRDVAPGEFGPAIQRSIVIGEDLWTLSHDSLARHDLASLAREAVVPLR